MVMNILALFIYAHDKQSEMPYKSSLNVLVDMTKTDVRQTPL